MSGQPRCEPVYHFTRLLPGWTGAAMEGVANGVSQS